jgi:hypothetical protein
MKEPYFFEMSVMIYQIRRRHIQEGNLIFTASGIKTSNILRSNYMLLLPSKAFVITTQTNSMILNPLRAATHLPQTVVRQ